MKTNIIKNIIKSTAFIVILCIMFYCVFSILWLNRLPIAFFFHEPKNTMDIVYIGPSTAYEHFNTTLAYDLYGYTTGIIASNEQPIASIQYLIKESQKYQTPKLYIIDISGIIAKAKDMPKGVIRATADFMPFSKNRTDAINKLLKYRNENKSEYINYYLSFLLYHNRWKNITDKNYTKDNYYKGFILVPATVKKTPQAEYQWTQETSELIDENKEALLELIDYIKLNNLNVLFIVPQKVLEEEKVKQINSAINIIKENEFNIINLNTIEEIKIDLGSDFHDTAHLNVYGATKNTLYFAKYLKENYDLPDHRNDKAYDSWKSEYERFKKDFKNLTQEDFDNLLQ